ncbi:MAG: hypothetical protein OIF50_10540 [Flavobacteriaceae bacterium]|nr:hypothetical protein [Flavobacteriaceae bacterium]
MKYLQRILSLPKIATPILWTLFVLVIIISMVLPHFRFGNYRFLWKYGFLGLQLGLVFLLIWSLSLPIWVRTFQKEHYYQQTKIWLLGCFPGILVLYAYFF